ncbi:hypothetical protein BJ138DRAFT_810495 [Hygrophoropsis aurantiaca]|uniref:Uncharacterized protein n=1 Tax=Hygrophoropsis aurantiaca TaxID=72124 RepID=A0ACB8AG53_9AGAM|nr:hypothetical protein BJ138DRAFT_810495 [Hygrophoropsis aurantiaca]
MSGSPAFVSDPSTISSDVDELRRLSCCGSLSTPRLRCCASFPVFFSLSSCPSGASWNSSTLPCLLSGSRDSTPFSAPSFRLPVTGESQTSGDSSVSPDDEKGGRIWGILELFTSIPVVFDSLLLFTVCISQLSFPPLTLGKPTELRAKGILPLVSIIGIRGLARPMVFGAAFLCCGILKQRNPHVYPDVQESVNKNVMRQ